MLLVVNIEKSQLVAQIIGQRRYKMDCLTSALNGNTGIAKVEKRTDEMMALTEENQWKGVVD